MSDLRTVAFIWGEQAPLAAIFSRGKNGFIAIRPKSEKARISACPRRLCQTCSMTIPFGQYFVKIVFSLFRQKVSLAFSVRGQPRP